VNDAVLPAEYRLMVIPTTDGSRDAIAYRLVAIDLTGAHHHAELASWEMPARVPNTNGPLFSASADATSIAIVAAGSAGGANAALYLANTKTHSVRSLVDEPAVHALSPRLSADGRQLAYLRLPVTQTASSLTEDGVWAADLGRVPLAWDKIIAPESPSTTDPLGWSPDGRWLAFARRFLGGTVYLAPRDGGTSLKVGPGTWASWRAWEPRLLVGGMAEPPAKAAVTLFDVARRTAAPLFTVDAPELIVSRGEWHPTLDRVLYQQIIRQLPQQPATVWTRYADGRAAKQIASGTFMFDVWWSADGSRMYAMSGGDDSTFGVGDLLANTFVTKACWRGTLTAAACL
jgi:Tol biopolymer transport system component